MLVNGLYLCCCQKVLDQVQRALCGLQIVLTHSQIGFLHAAEQESVRLRIVLLALTEHSRASARSSKSIDKNTTTHGTWSESQLQPRDDRRSDSRPRSHLLCSANAAGCLVAHTLVGTVHSRCLTWTQQQNWQLAASICTKKQVKVEQRHRRLMQALLLNPAKSSGTSPPSSCMQKGHIVAAYMMLSVCKATQSSPGDVLLPPAGIPASHLLPARD